MSGGPPSRLRVVDFGPDRTWLHPGSEAVASLTLESDGGAVDARVELLDEARIVAATERQLRLPAGVAVRQFRLRLPEAGRHGYGLRVQVEGRRSSVEAHAAVEALEGWWESPRHAALTEFGPYVAVGPTVDRLRRWHVNVVQFYDWMYRHYRYRPPARQRVFTDTLGRVVSHDAVRQLVRGFHRHGVASLAYGSVYGAEAEHTDRHPEDLLRDAAGEPLSLGGTFFITDLRPGSPWRRRLIDEYVRACTRFGFDGIHMDQYGEPHSGTAADGSLVELDGVFRGLIDEAASELARLMPRRRVLFNCVGGWPLESVAAAASAATYIEVWPPDTTYSALVRLVEQARRLAPDKQVVIAAYPSVIAAARDNRALLPRAIEAALLLTSVVMAAGAYHHALAENDRVLTGGYYPEAALLPPEAADEMRAAWQFSARYVHLLSDTGSRPLALEGLRIEAGGRSLPISAEPRPGLVWARGLKTDDGRPVVQLVDLLDQAGDEWDELRQPVRDRSDWQVTIPRSLGDGTWRFASPWSVAGTTRKLDRTAALKLPSFRRWGVLVRDVPLSG